MQISPNQLPVIPAKQTLPPSQPGNATSFGQTPAQPTLLTRPSQQVFGSSELHDVQQARIVRTLAQLDKSSYFSTQSKPLPAPVQAYLQIANLSENTAKTGLIDERV
ncbi:hypothetical protein Q7C_1239 [Methylophaga frappieri]|uniref:Uncharacterized protein n=1 Tax=Methylophaga frappieri (strain ATCC BAA-2434 / DSM 25690 / JAM7) TaxID=754477 RepID=I1YHJ6_METFJ|nr:hypothetical protein [Methylophaga frappieri]AFJ02389.1 hypothetical protein Q7C_1239 [Methylophaga frappieri]